MDLRIEKYVLGRTAIQCHSVSPRALTSPVTPNQAAFLSATQNDVGVCQPFTLLHCSGVDGTTSVIVVPKWIMDVVQPIAGDKTNAAVLGLQEKVVAAIVTVVVLRNIGTSREKRGRSGQRNSAARCKYRSVFRAVAAASSLEGSLELNIPVRD